MRVVKVGRISVGPFISSPAHVQFDRCRKVKAAVSFRKKKYRPWSFLLYVSWLVCVFVDLFVGSVAPAVLYQAFVCSLVWLFGLFVRGICTWCNMCVVDVVFMVYFILFVVCDINSFLFIYFLFYLLFVHLCRNMCGSLFVPWYSFLLVCHFIHGSMGEYCINSLFLPWFNVAWFVIININSVTNNYVRYLHARYILAPGLRYRYVVCFCLL